MVTCTCGWTGRPVDLKTYRLLDSVVEGCPACGREVQPMEATKVVAPQMVETHTYRSPCTAHVRVDLEGIEYSRQLDALMGKEVMIGDCRFILTRMEVETPEAGESCPRGPFASLRLPLRRRFDFEAVELPLISDAEDHGDDSDDSDDGL